jgi:hypothetical protein
MLKSLNPVNTRCDLTNCSSVNSAFDLNEPRARAVMPSCVIHIDFSSRLLRSCSWSARGSSRCVLTPFVAPPSLLPPSLFHIPSMHVSPLRTESRERRGRYLPPIPHRRWIFNSFTDVTGDYMQPHPRCISQIRQHSRVLVSAQANVRSVCL